MSYLELTKIEQAASSNSPVVTSSAIISTVRDFSHRKDLAKNVKRLVITVSCYLYLFWGTTNCKGFMVSEVELMNLLTDLVIGSVLFCPG